MPLWERDRVFARALGFLPNKEGQLTTQYSRASVAMSVFCLVNLILGRTSLFETRRILKLASSLNLKKGCAQLVRHRC